MMASSAASSSTHPLNRRSGWPSVAARPSTSPPVTWRSRSMWSVPSAIVRGMVPPGGCRDVAALRGHVELGGNTVDQAIPARVDVARNPRGLVARGAGRDDVGDVREHPRQRDGVPGAVGGLALEPVGETGEGALVLGR